ncbi:short-chain dehydrogenase/reductase 2b-like [Cryptomeria japonica]|uniref:short-chain dehydrogenase/reductase 2b-like n=1 Tax=Cryptomeria japonica TaxID=3369 RepID=UPI0027DA25E3|nr:short-chain dehydrogenase/reductase 2b-like [Cryptomeria japonica]
MYFSVSKQMKNATALGQGMNWEVMDKTGMDMCQLLDHKWWSEETGANRGIGLEIVRQLACKGMTVVLTCRNEKNGLAAMKDLGEAGLDNVHFHILDVQSSQSVSDLAQWLKTMFGGLDILINNAAVAGQGVNREVMEKVFGFGLILSHNVPACLIIGQCVYVPVDAL